VLASWVGGVLPTPRNASRRHQWRHDLTVRPAAFRPTAAAPTVPCSWLPATPVRS